MQSKAISPQYCSFYAAGSLDVDIPLNMEGPGLVVAPDCINIPALYYNEGDTTVLAGHFFEVARRRKPDFDGMLDTPVGVVLLFDANEDDMMRIPADKPQTRIRIWINHPTQPDEVRIAVGD